MGIDGKPNFYFFALAPTGDGISGGDRIFIEISSVWSKSLPVNIYTTSEGMAMMGRFKLSGKFLKIIEIGRKKLPGFFPLKYFYKIYLGLKLSFLTFNLQPSTIIFSTSEFWMDSLPCFILKLRFPKVIWVAAWYQTAPKPFIGFAEGKRNNVYKFAAFLYWAVQFFIKPIIQKYADFVIVNNETEKKQFKNLSKKEKVLVVYGGVDTNQIKKYKQQYRDLPKIYDVVFQGRFHPQKGVVELIEIWKKVVEKRPKARLAMIGDGSLMPQVKDKIRKLKLEKNVRLFGYVFEGLQKYKIFVQSKVVVHPAFYDSGGMSSAEAMAFGLPCIGFNLEAYKSYYPKGMIKAKIGDLSAIAKNILKLLDNDKLRKEIADEGVRMIEEDWSWDKKASFILNRISKIR